jgi:hypothetical protein
MENLMDDINYIPSIEEVEIVTKNFLKVNNIVEKTTKGDKNIKITKP